MVTANQRTKHSTNIEPLVLVREKEMSLLLYIRANSSQKIAYNDEPTSTAVESLEKKELIRFAGMMGLGGIPEYRLTDKGQETYDSLSAHVERIYQILPHLNN
jgi:hypothetical protein